MEATTNPQKCPSDYLPTGSHMDWLMHYAQKMTEPALGEYIGRIERRLSQMYPGTEWYYPREVKPENMDLFIKTVAMYIEQGHPEFEFSNDYLTIKKNFPYEPIKPNKPLHDIERLKYSEEI